MPTLNTNSKNAMVLNLRNNSERETIIKSISASGEFEIHEADGVVTIYIKASNLRKMETKHSKTFFCRNQTRHIFRKIKNKKHSSILERVAKSQNISLAESKSLDAICAGVIV